MCRSHFPPSSVAVPAGAAAWLATDAGPAESVYLLMAAWMLYLPPRFVHLLVLLLPMPVRLYPKSANIELRTSLENKAHRVSEEIGRYPMSVSSY